MKEMREGILAYHDATKHTIEKLHASPHTLDWANMPDPFRHYEGVPLVDLAPGESADPIAWLLFHAAAISASKVVPSTGYRYALRVNPSSGNLHPTEFHFATRGVSGWRDGLYHYRPSSHMAETRMQGDLASEWLRLALAPWFGSQPVVVFALASIAWREAWKYRDRAYRYCLHDIGHAWGCLALAAEAMGTEARAFGHFVDADLARSLGVEDEWPMLLAAIPLPGQRGEQEPRQWMGGTPNALSPVLVPYPAIDQAHAWTSLAAPLGPIARAPAAGEGSGAIQLPEPAAALRPFAEAARARRSALDFRGGNETMSLAQLAALLEAASQPFLADFEGDLQGEPSSRLVSLYLYAHRVEGLAPGVYRYWPASRSLELKRAGDQRLIAAGLSLGQDLAGNCCVAFSMVADLDRALSAFGDRGYRYCFFEAGHIGQRFYLTAERLGLQCTGIGAFYDDQVHRYLDLEPSDGQVIYHFACGYAVHDPRLDAS